MSKGGAGRVQSSANQVANRQPSAGQVRYGNIYIGFVMDNNDSERMGRVKVWIPDFAGDKNDESSWFLVNYTSPFAGATNIDDTSESQGQTSYGTWNPPPDIGNQVVVGFISGDPSRGVILGSLFESRMNYMVPGLPASKTVVQDGKIEYGISQEYNKSSSSVNTNQPIRPALTTFQEQLKKQGLDKDRVRAVNTSSARRESPSKVSGTLTRSGWQMFFDEHKEEDYFRLRSPKGAQIMINDKHGMIYIITRDGNSWVEMTGDGQIQIFSEKSINMHTNEDFNIQAKRDINLEAGRNISLKTLGSGAGDKAGSGNILIETKDSFHLKSTKTINLQSDTTTNIKSNNMYISVNNSFHVGSNDIQLFGSSNVAVSSGGNCNLTAGGVVAADGSLIHLNSGASSSASPTAAQPAQPPTIYKLNDNKTVKESIASTVPEHEPWKPHKLEGNTIVDDRGASQMIVGEQAAKPQAQPKTNSEPYKFEPLSDVLKNEDYVPPDNTNCSDNKPVLEHELSDVGVRHILQNNEYSPYAKTDNTGSTIFGYDVFEPFRNIGDSLFKHFPEGITEEQAVKKSRASLQGDVQTVKRMFGGQSTPVSQQQFDALVGLVHHVGAANVAKYTDLPNMIGSGRFDDAGVIMNQLEWQTPTLSNQSNSIAALWNQCDYGTSNLPSKGATTNRNALNNIYGLFSGLTIKQQRQVAGVSAQTGDLMALHNMYPNNQVIGQIAEDTQNNWAGFMKHEYFNEPVYSGTYLYRMIIENKASENNLTQPSTGNAITINLVGCEDLSSYNNNFPKTLPITKNYTLGDFLIGGSINGVLGVSKTEVVCNIRNLTDQIFEPMISSGMLKDNIVIRSAIRNGSDTGDHTKGCAVDFYLKNYGISVVDIAIWIENNLDGSYDDLVIENCEDLTSIVHISRSRDNQVGLGRKLWKPSRQMDAYLLISENNATYGGGWTSFGDMKLNPAKAKINMEWMKKII